MAKHQRILLIEDDQDLRQTVDDLLTEEGYQVVASRDGREGLHQLEVDPKFGLIILDLMLPNMNGWEFRLLQWKNPDFQGIPVLAMSAAATLRQTAELLQVDGFISKPIDLKVLIAAVSAFILPE